MESGVIPLPKSHVDSVLYPSLVSADWLYIGK